jgi:hypothetical protein
MPRAQATLREILDDPKASPGYRVAAAKETREAASAARQQPGANEKYSIIINFGHTIQRHIEVQNPQPKVDTHRTLEYQDSTRRAEAVPSDEEDQRE